MEDLTNIGNHYVAYRLVMAKTLNTCLYSVSDLSCSDAKINKSSAVAEMGDRLATIGMGRKWGGAAVAAGSPLGPRLTQSRLGRGLPPYQVAS